MANATAETKEPEVKKTTPKKEDEKKKELPPIVTKSRGRVSKTKELLMLMFMRENPGYKTRWVYDNEAKPDRSNVLTRTADGYQLVFGKELGDNFTGVSDKQVRVGDLVMMKIPDAGKKALEQEQFEKAKAQRDRVKSSFYGAQEGVSATTKDGRTHGAKPKGGVNIEDRTIDLDKLDKGE